MISNKELLDCAYQARERAYAPYSKFFVGAALLSKSGTVYLGCNVENASYGGTICAERVAFTKAISEGEREFVKIAVVTEKGKLIVPCGLCLQLMSEFGDIGVVTAEGERPLSAYLPYAFGKEFL